MVNFKLPEVAHLAGDYRELLPLGDGGDHPLFVEDVGLAVHQLSPAAECRAIHAEDVEGGAHLIEPAFARIGFCRVLIAAEFDPGLDLAAGGVRGNGLKPPLLPRRSGRWPRDCRWWLDPPGLEGNSTGRSIPHFRGS